MTPLMHPLADVFLLGFIAACSIVATIFFLRYWRDARDPLFLAFAAFFGIQGIVHSARPLAPSPKRGKLLGVLDTLTFSSRATRSDSVEELCEALTTTIAN